MTVEQIVEKYSTMLFRICLLILCSEADAKDVVQDTLVSFMENKKEFKDEEHEKAWLIRVARNRAMDRIRFQKRHPVVDIEEITVCYETQEEKNVLRCILELPAKYKEVMYLFYIEGYSMKEVAQIVHISNDAVKKRMQRGRVLLKEQLKGVVDYEKYI